ncbi:MAG: hypothetical protein ACRDGR_00600 [bacterium]
MTRRLLAALATPVCVAAAAAAAEEDAPIGRPLVRGGIYDKPFFARLGEGAAVGGYVDAQFRWERADGVTDELTFLVERFNLFTYASLSDRVRVASELEFEEGGREVTIELAIIDFEIHEALALRGGIVLSPLGRFNLAHDSPANELTDRPLVSTEIIPATLSEPGIGFFGALHPSATSLVTWEAYAVNGFSEGILEEDGSGTRIPAGKGNWEDGNNRPSFVSRVAASPVGSAELGLSVHTGPYNLFEEGGLAVDERRDVTIFAADGELRAAPFRLTGEWARAWIDVPPAFPAAESQQGFYAELSAPFLEGAIPNLPESRFTAAVRVDVVDFDLDVSGDDRRRLTLGLNFRPIGETVFKLDWQRERERDAFENVAEKAALLFSAASYF